MNIGVMQDNSVSGAVATVPTVGDGLVEPAVTVADHSLPATQLAAQILAARRYDSFWNTGEESLLRAALAANFTDHTPLPGHSPGSAGPLATSKAMRAAIPDMSCAVEQMIVAGDRVVAQLRVRGHFTGVFNGVPGKGQVVDFIAIDIYRVVDGRITDDWHLEDNLMLLRQIGLSAR